MLRISSIPDVADPWRNPQNRHSGGICPHPPDHRSPSPKGWLQIVNQTAGFYSTKMTAMSTSASITCPAYLARSLKQVLLESEIRACNRARDAAASPRISAKIQAFAEIQH
jgi:hypothetical protein